MDPNLTTVVLALIAAVVAPVVTFFIKYAQDRKIAEKLAMKVEETAVISDAKLDAFTSL